MRLVKKEEELTYDGIDIDWKIYTSPKGQVYRWYWLNEKDKYIEVY